jgi:putative membrane protein
MTAQGLPAVNASLNAATTVLLVAGFVCIKRRNIAAHRACMLSAFGLSVAFLACYLAHKFLVGPKHFGGRGWVRPLYFAILLTHTVLAVVNLPLILRALWLALHGRFEAHRRLARWAWPAWMYVSVTGVVVYVMLYRMRF